MAAAAPRSKPGDPPPPMRCAPCGQGRSSAGGSTPPTPAGRTQAGAPLFPRAALVCEQTPSSVLREAGESGTATCSLARVRRRARKTGTRCNSPPRQAARRPPAPPPPAGPDPHTQACVFTRARISARTHSRTGTPARAHTQGYNKGRGGSAALLFPVSSPLWGSPPAPGLARWAPHPALRSPRPQPAAGIPARRVRNFAPGRPSLAARRAGDKSCGAA